MKLEYFWQFIMKNTPYISIVIHYKPDNNSIFSHYNNQSKFAVI